MFGRKQDDFSAEIEAHLQLEIERLREQGLSREEAETAAHRKFGNVTRAQERFYESHRWMWFDRLKQDAHFGLRMLAKNPGFTLVAVVTLAFGIGANSGIFSLIHAVLLRPLPFAEPERVVSVWERRPSSRDAKLPISGHEYMAWKEQSHVFDGLALYSGGSVTITGGGEPETLHLLVGSAEIFTVLGVRPTLGRTFLPGEDRAGHNRVVVLSDSFWRRRFASDAKVVDQAITLNDQAYTVVGVMPPLPASFTPDIWMPIDLPGEVRRVGRHCCRVIGRLKPGITMEQAQSDLDVVAHTLELRIPDDNTDHKVAVLPVRKDLTGDVQRALVVLMGAVGFVLLIACLNVASLLLTRAAGRQREMAIRKSLGATRLRLIQQLITESLLLSAMGGALGLMLATWLARVLPHLHGLSIPLIETMTIDRPVLAVTTLLTLFSGIAAGVTPALQGSQSRALQGMADGRQITTEPGKRRLGAVLVATQVALALVLLVGAGLLMKSFLRLVNVDAGFTTEHVLVTSVSLPPRYSQEKRSLRFFDELSERMAALPGVQSVGGITELPLQGGDNWSPFSIEGRPAPPPGRGLYAQQRVVSPGYFRTLGIPLRAGRFFAADDARISVPLIRWYEQQPIPPQFDQPQPLPVAIISESMARQYWPGENPIGRRVRVLFSPWITIVGVVGDVKHNALDAPSYPNIYLLHSQEPQSEMALVVRTTGEPLDLAAAAREQVRGLDAGLPVTVTEMSDVVSDSVSRPRFYFLLGGIFSAMALGLAVVGIFGLTSYSVSQRVREIGIRMALGAQRSDILWMILRQGWLPAVAGLVAGSAGALALAGVIKSLLFHVSPGDPMTLAGVLLLIAPVTLLACYVPARRAMKVDPNVALRYE
jgi:putative ABC transport system permease protein